MNIDRIKKDLKIAFDKEIKPFKEIKDTEIARYSYILNGIIKEILNSYYFEGRYETSLLKVKSNNSDVFLLKTNLNENESIEGFFNDKFDFNLKYQKVATYKVLEEYNLLISHLKNDSNYSVIFEKDEIKKSLNLKEKNVIDFSIIDLKVDMNKFLNLNKVKNELELTKKLREHDLDLCLPLIITSDYFIIAHNNKGVVGFVSVQNNEYSNDSKVKSINYIKVRKEFRSQKIATKLFKEVKKHSNKNNHLLEINNLTRFSKHITIDHEIFKDDFIIKGNLTDSRRIIDNVLRKINNWEVSVDILKELNQKGMKDTNITNINSFIESKLNPVKETLLPEVEIDSKIKKLIKRIF